MPGNDQHIDPIAVLNIERPISRLRVGTDDIAKRSSIHSHSFLEAPVKSFRVNAPCSNRRCSNRNCERRDLLPLNLVT
ncbi:hypothetical protein D3C81_1526720 [compost metagenome]